MSVIRELHVRAAPEAVVAALHARLGRSDDVLQDVRHGGDRSYAIAVYEQYFHRVKNRIALMVVADDFTADGSTHVRVVATGSSPGLIITFDWGAAGAYVNEAVAIINGLEEGSGP